MSTYKSAKVILLAASLAVFAFCALGIVGRGDRLSTLAVDETAFAALEQGRQPTDEPLLTGLLFNGYELTLDEQTDTFYYSIVQGNAQWHNPQVGFTTNALGVSVAFLQAELNDQSVAASRQSRILAYTNQVYRAYNLICTTLPLISLRVLTDDGWIGRVDTPMQMRLFDNRKEANHIQRVLNSAGKVRVRGASSLHYPKKSFRLSLTAQSPGGNERNNLLSLLGERQDDDWILYSPYNDPEKIRNTFSHNLWWAYGAANNSFNIRNGTPGKLVELFINGRYWGIYTLMHPIDAKQLSLTDTGDPLTSDIYYRSISYVQTTADMFLGAQEAITGRFEIRDPDSDIYDYNYWAPLEQWLRLLESQDNYFAEHYPQRAELDNIADMWLFNNITMSADNLGKNQNLVAKYRHGAYTMLFSPWDLDQTWGNVWVEGLPLLTDVRYPTDVLLHDGDTGIARALALNVADINGRLRSRYAYLRGTLLSDESLAAMLAGYEKDIYGSGAHLRDRERWPHAAYNEDMSQIRAIVASRMAFWDGYMATLGQVNP